MTLFLLLIRTAGAFLWALAVSSLAVADDGVIEINHAAVMAGGITILDAPGYPASLNAAGTYRLTGPLTVVQGTAIVINSTVDLDLNGFAVTCNSVFGSCSQTPGMGIDGTSVLATRAVVRNGRVFGFNLGGVVLGRESRVEDVSAEQNGIAGIAVGNDSAVEGCIAVDNSVGIRVAARGTVRRSNAFSNAGHGITGAADAVVVDSRASENEGDGINLGAGATLERTHADGNTGDGVNTGYGIRALDNASVSGSTASRNGLSGIRVGYHSVLQGNQAASNGRDGITLEGGSTVSGNAAAQNGHDGISMNAAVGPLPLGSTMIGNTATNNGTAVNFGRGIDCPGTCLVRKNTVQGNDVGLGLAANSTYSQNVIANNTTPVIGGVNLGDNYCTGGGTVSASCP